LSEAYGLLNDGKYTPMPYAVYNDDILVGFIMAEYQPIDEDDIEDDENAYYLSRMMIDKRYQGNGYGKEAMLKLIEIMKTHPYGEAEAVVLSCSRKNVVAYNFTNHWVLWILVISMNLKMFIVDWSCRYSGY